MRRKKEDFAKKVADELQLPETAVANVCHIEFNGRSDVTVDGCKGVVEYNEDVIALNLGKDILRFRGANLEIATFSEAQAVIKGDIAIMEFSS